MSVLTMAADEIKLGSGEGSDDLGAGARGKVKKRSTLAKLVERKRQGRIGNKDSECRSCLSLQDACSAPRSSELDMTAEQKAPSKCLPCYNDQDGKPVPKPRKNSRSGDIQNVGIDNINEGLSSIAVEADKVKKSPSDSTIYRFRTIRMAADQADLTDSLKQSPFVPKPPLTPRTPRTVAVTQSKENGKNEALHLESVQSDEDELRNVEEQKMGKDFAACETKVSDQQQLVLYSGQSAGADNQDQADQTYKDLQEQYTRILSDLKDNGQLESGQRAIQGQNRRTESVLSDPTDSGSRLGHLMPVPFKNAPPPLDADVASHTLRTAYKADRGYWACMPHTHRKRNKPMSDGGSGGRHGSDMSFTSSSVMPVITTKEARSRSFLVGSVGSGVYSMLGPEELERYFPDRRIHIWVGTWNMNEIKDVAISLNDFILPLEHDLVQDIYAVGTQENCVNRAEWEIKIQETLGPTHVLLHSVWFGSLHLVIFIRRDLIWFCSVPENAEVTLRAMSMVKTKGAIGISFSLFGTSFLFINSHLAADRGSSRNEIRMQDYVKVIKKLQLPRQGTRSFQTHKTDVTTQFDCVFWCGDLNFRLETRRETVMAKVIQMTSEDSIPHFEELLKSDQLSKFITEGKIFEGFQEGRINFPPTFKFDIDSDNYDTSQKNRNPSYTDRVMFRSRKKNHITCLHYDCVRNIKVSDHRAVFALFEAVLRPGRDGGCLNGGQFDRNVYLEANRRRAMLQHLAGQKNSSVCVLQ